MTITTDQLARRSSGLFSSDVARIMTGDGVRVTLEKLGEIEPDSLDDVPSVQLGNVLEGPILDAYERVRPALNLRRSLDTMMHPEVPWLGCHLDALAIQIDHIVVVEAKAYSVFNRSEWGDPGTDAVPVARMWQCMAQIAVTGAVRADIPVCFVDAAALTTYLTNGTVPIEIFEIPRHDDLIAYMVDECAKVWRCIEARTLPEPVHVGDATLIYRRDDGGIVEATDEIARAHQELLEVRAQIGGLEARKEQLEETIKAFMRGAAEMRSNGLTLATWRSAKESRHFNAKALAESLPDVYEQFRETKPGARRFLIKETSK